ncbi:MAG: MATE family efflux transporter [Lachnospiraceae bacterium]|nr:MATE family efflux transporter [Lachnospiraceae bacterium]
MSKNDRMAMMAELPVHQVLIKMSLPMMISFFIQAMYNIVDSMFVARISENALTAVSLAFPMQQIVTAIGVGTSTGVSAVWSRFVGMGEKERASQTIRTMTVMSLFFSGIFVLLGIFASGPIYAMQTDVEDIALMGTAYLTINWVLSFGSIFGKYYERLLVSAGLSMLSMAAMASGAVFNLIFDPLLIFGLGPFPAMGIRGAAYATVGGQIFAVIVALILNIRHNEAVRKDLFRLNFRLSAARDILRVGLPSIITMGLSSMTSFFINQILLVYSTTATAVYGVWMKLQNFCYMPTFGLNNGMVPILSYNYGIGKKDRVRLAMKEAILAIGALMVFLMIVFELIPGVVLSLFSAGETMRDIGMVCLRFCVISLPFGALSMIMSTSMQALDHVRYSFVINMMRQCVLLILSFYLVSELTHSQKLIWAAVPATEIITFLAAIVFFSRFRKNLAKN